MNEWSYLPNAAHIDRILADLKANPDRWIAVVNSATYPDAYDAARTAIYTAAALAAWTAALAAWTAARTAAWNAARDAAWRAASAAFAYDAARTAILALIAYDDCAYLLNEKPEDVHMFALLGQPAAILLYPACLALSEQKEKELT